MTEIQTIRTMPSENIYRYIAIDEQSVTPKYLQLTNAILKGIASGKIEENYILPSINDLSYELEISRDTAERAYRNLKKIGVVGGDVDSAFMSKSAAAYVGEMIIRWKVGKLCDSTGHRLA